MIRIPEAVEMDVVAGPGAEGARRATGGPGPVTTSRPSDPDPEVPATVQRRRFSAEYRLRILKQADACKKPGEVGAPVTSRGVVLVAADELAAAARGGGAARDAGAPPGAPPRRPAHEAAGGGEPPAPAEAAAGGDDHHTPKKSCRDPGPRAASGLEKSDLEQTVSKSAIETQKTGRRTVRAKPEQMVRETVDETRRSGSRATRPACDRILIKWFEAPPADGVEQLASWGSPSCYVSTCPRPVESA